MWCPAVVAQIVRFLWLECAVSDAQEKGHGAGDEVRGHEVLLPVPIHISDRDGDRGIARFVVHLRVKGSISMPQKNGGGVRAAEIRGRQIRVPIATQIPDRDGDGVASRPIVHSGRKEAFRLDGNERAIRLLRHSRRVP